MPPSPFLARFYPAFNFWRAPTELTDRSWLVQPDEEPRAFLLRIWKTCLPGPILLERTEMALEVSSLRGETTSMPFWSVAESSGLIPLWFAAFIDCRCWVPGGCILLRN